MTFRIIKNEKLFTTIHMKYDLMTPQKLDKNLISFKKVILNQ